MLRLRFPVSRFKAELAEPFGDRVAEALRVAREVESRQSWTANAARLAVVAPWVVLLLMSFQRYVVSRRG